MLQNYASANMSETTSEWVRTASSDDVALAIELGYPLLCKVKGMVAQKVAEATSKLSPTPVDLPVAKGQIGEAFVENILARRFGTVANVSKNPRSSDLTLFLSHRKIIIEVKNYSNHVPISGVEKFQRDLCTTNACGGVFISLKTPITSVTTDFTIRYEQSDTKTIPCAYIVSSDENTIIVAVNMISNLISAFEYVASELYNRDRILGGVYEVAERLDDVSKVRNDLQVGIGEITSQLMKTSLRLITAEAGIRQAVDGIRSELFHIQTPDIEPALAELEKVPNFSKYTTETKKLIGSVMRCVQEMLPRNDINGGYWKLSAKKCSNALTDISFNFLTNKVYVSIPRTKISSQLITKALDIFGKKVSVDDHLHVELDKLTHEWIISVLRLEKLV